MKKKNIHSGYRDGICHAEHEKQKIANNRRKRSTTSEKIIRLGEKETYRYLVILEADTIKQEKREEKMQKACFRRKGKLSKTSQ